MPGKIREAYRTWIANHQAQDTVTAGWRSDQSPLLVTQAVGSEALEGPAIGMQHPDRGELGTDHLGGHVDHPFYHPFKGGFSGKGDTRLDQQVQSPTFAQGMGH